MSRWRQSAWRSGTAALALLAAAGVASAAPCDEYDPQGPAMSARVTLDASDLVQLHGDELRSFIATGSLGKVEAAVVSAIPRDAVAALSAVPAVSRFSGDYGEKLRGIAVTVALRRAARTARVVVDLRQVCARHFVNTFLYY